MNKQKLLLQDPSCLAKQLGIKIDNVLKKVFTLILKFSFESHRTIRFKTRKRGNNHFGTQSAYPLIYHVLFQATVCRTSSHIFGKIH